LARSEVVSEIAALAVLAIDTMVSSGTMVQTGMGMDSMIVYNMRDAV
jgi:hypothetical protein